MLPQLFYAIVCAPAQRMFAVRWPGLRRTLTLTCGGVLRLTLRHHQQQQWNEALEAGFH